jgi:hypothetical protein
MVRQSNNSSSPPSMLLPQHVSVIWPPDDGRMTERCCGSNIGGGEEELLRWRIINCWRNWRCQFDSEVCLSSGRYSVFETAYATHSISPASLVQCTKKPRVRSCVTHNMGSLLLVYVCRRAGGPLKGMCSSQGYSALSVRLLMLPRKQHMPAALSISGVLLYCLFCSLIYVIYLAIWRHWNNCKWYSAPGWGVGK